MGLESCCGDGQTRRERATQTRRSVLGGHAPSHSLWGDHPHASVAAGLLDSLSFFPRSHPLANGQSFETGSGVQSKV